jgi:hypothetical protein
LLDLKSFKVERSGQIQRNILSGSPKAGQIPAAGTIIQRVDYDEDHHSGDSSVKVYPFNHAGASQHPLTGIDTQEQEVRRFIVHCGSAYGPLMAIYGMCYSSLISPRHQARH